MSFKAIVNNKRKEIRFVVNQKDGWSFGVTTGWNIPSGYCKYGACRFIGNKILRNEIYGKLVKINEADNIAYEAGVIYPYTRNCCKFVMSRAARKRGYTTNDFTYRDKVARKYKKAN